VTTAAGGPNFTRESVTEIHIEAQPVKTNIGLWYMLMGSVTMGLMNIIASALKVYTDITVFEVCYFRALVMALGCIFHSWYKGFTILDIPNEGNLPSLVSMRAVFGYFSFTCSFVSIYLMPLSIAMVIFFTQPISAALVNYSLGRERLSILDIVSIFSAMIGVIILTTPSLLIPSKYLGDHTLQLEF
jgi:drug/metabolite transporter (DMT)-like permease